MMSRYWRLTSDGVRLTRMRYLFLLICLSFAAFSACSQDSDPHPGRKGRVKLGKSRVPATCHAGQCSADEAPDTPDQLAIEFNVAERRLTAGKDKTPLFVSATIGDTDKPYGTLVVYPSPSTAGTIGSFQTGDLPKPGRFVELELNDEGTSTPGIACDRGALGIEDCPEFVFLNIARPAVEEKFEPIGRSPAIKLLTNSTSDDPTLDESKCNERGVHIVVRTNSDAEEDTILSARPTIDLESGELSLIGAGLNLTLRAGIGQTQSDTTNISRLDIALEVGESLMLPSPCDYGGALFGRALIPKTPRSCVANSRL